MGNHTTLKDKHELVLFYKIINGLAPQYMLDLIYSCFSTDDHTYTCLCAIFNVFHFFALLLIAVALFHLQLNYGTILMQKLTIHKFYSFWSQNLKTLFKNIPQVYKHFNFGNRKETIFDVNFGIKLVILMLSYLKSFNWWDSKFIVWSKSKGNKKCYSRISKIH